MKKALKRIGIGILLTPFILVAVYILWEIVGIICNNIAGEMQTSDLKGLCKDIGTVADTDTFVGNTGNGNHVDLVSTLLIESDKSEEEMGSRLEEEYDYVSVYELGKLIENDSHKLDELEIPENWEDSNYYVVYVFQSAPFSDNIMGH